MAHPGPELALLLLAGYRTLVDAVVAELEASGYSSVTPVHHYALAAIESGADTASDLGRRLGVSKQAAAKTLRALESSGYVVVADDPADARRRRVEVSPAGHEVMAAGADAFDALRLQWREQVGERDLAALERILRQVVGGVVAPEAPGWVATQA